MSNKPRAAMHASSPDTARLREKVLDYARERMEFDPVPLDTPQTEAYLREHAPNTVNSKGLGGDEALRVFAEVLAPACLSTDHPGYLSFIPTAPTEASTLFDLVVSASSIYGGSWLEGSGAVFAENEVLAWLARETGLPETSGGVFVQGGTLGNLSALVAARHTAMTLRDGRPERWKVICSAEAHSSIKSAARVMDIDVVLATPDANGRLHGQAVRDALKAEGDGVFAIIATAGTTNFGIVDKLREIGEVAREHQIWYHIDGAYGLAGLLATATRELFDGTELADSFIVDPHKWLFAPFDACALVYRNPELAKAAHTQHGEYLDTLTDGDAFNPSDYAYNLTRRVRGLPLWFSLATHGTSAYSDAVSQNIETANAIAKVIRERDDLELVREPELSVVVFKKKGWTLADYDRWSSKLLDSGVAFVVPSSHKGEPNTRFAIVNPRTTLKLLVKILDTMKDD